MFLYVLSDGGGSLVIGLTCRLCRLDDESLGYFACPLVVDGDDGTVGYVLVGKEMSF